MREVQKVYHDMDMRRVSYEQREKELETIMDQEVMVTEVIESLGSQEMDHNIETLPDQPQAPSLQMEDTNEAIDAATTMCYSPSS